MPNLTTHYICGKIIKEKLDIESNDFLVGCILPDYIENAHYKKQLNNFLIPDIELFINSFKTENNYIFLGVLTHLLLDKYYIEEYVINNIYKRIPLTENIFQKDKIYNEYTLISKPSLQEHNIDIKEIVNKFKSTEFNLNTIKFNKDIEEIANSQPNISNLKYIVFKEFLKFIEEASTKITNDVKQIHKQTIRQKIKTIRNNINKEEVKLKSNKIKTNLLNLLENLKSDNIFIYKSFQNEVSTDEIIKELLNQNKKVYLPKIQDNTLEIIPFTDTTNFSQNKFHIQEPNGEPIILDDFICITPLIATDKQGNRIGFGKGYYDNFLKDKNCIKIGLCYSFQITDKIFNENHDIKLDYIINEKEVLKI